MSTQRQQAERGSAGPAPGRTEEPVEGPAATYEPSRERTEPAQDSGTTAPQASGADQEAPASPAEELERLRGELDSERAKAADYLNQWQRAAADFSNFRRRTEQERSEMARLFNEGLVKQLLPVLDNFERALAAAPPEVRDSAWLEGVSLTEKQLRAALEKEGLRAIEAMGQPFDPNLHEAVAHGVSDDEEDRVIEEYQKGYKLHDRVIRPSMVKVSRRS